MRWNPQLCGVNEVSLKCLSCSETVSVWERRKLLRAETFFWSLGGEADLLPIALYTLLFGTFTREIKRYVSGAETSILIAKNDWVIIINIKTATSFIFFFSIGGTFIIFSPITMFISQPQIFNFLIFFINLWNKNYDYFHKKMQFFDFSNLCYFCYYYYYFFKSYGNSSIKGKYEKDNDWIMIG